MGAFYFTRVANKGGIMKNLLTPYAIEVFLPIAKWLAIGVILAMLIGWLVVYLMKKENFIPFMKTTLFILFVFLLALGIACLIMEIGKKYSESYADENGLDTVKVITHVLIPIVVLLFLLLATAITTIIIGNKASPENATRLTKKWLTIFGIIDVLALIVCGVLMAIYFESVKEWYETLNQPVLYISSALLIIVIVALAFILDKNQKPFDTRCIALAGITVAMSFGLSYVKLFEMPQGGSITLCSLLPIMIFSFVYGTKKGVFVCFIYGVLQAIQDPWIIHPAQFLLDYPVAFSTIGLSGVFANNFKKTPQVAFLLGGIVASVARFISHVLSGVFAFASTYAGDINSWLYSLGYNSFVFIDIAIVLVMGALVFSSKAFVKELNKQ